MGTFSEDAFEFSERRIVDGDMGAGVGLMGRLSGCDNMAKEDMKNLFCYKA